MARPVKTPFTEKEVGQIEKLSGLGLTVEQICGLFGIAKRTFERRLKYSPGGADALEKGRSKALVTVAQTAYDIATQDRNPAMVMFFLKCRGGWKEKSQVEHMGEDGKPIPVGMKLIIEDYTKPKA